MKWSNCQPEQITKIVQDLAVAVVVDTRKLNSLKRKQMDAYNSPTHTHERRRARCEFRWNVSEDEMKMNVFGDERFSNESKKERRCEMISRSDD